MTVIQVHWGKVPLFFNFGCGKYLQDFVRFLVTYHWRFDIYHNSAPVSTIDQTAESIKTEMMGEFWNWLNNQ